MSVYRDMAMDAGYSGEEADQMAQMLERQAYDDYQKHLEEQAAMDAHYQAIGEAINLLVSEGLGEKVWWCAQTESVGRFKNQRCVDLGSDGCGWRLLIPIPETQPATVPEPDTRLQKGEPVMDAPEDPYLWESGT